ncbi:hypothetical protein WJX79_005100 [Trebouxia sp. C0005]
MSCPAAHDLSLCGKHQACRQRFDWLRPRCRQAAAGAISFSRKRFSQPQTVLETHDSILNEDGHQAKDTGERR